ncbi:MAG: hypothetical protein QOJ16_1138 [Acidobacteriota bacterium]|jgi:Tol biopolymer transport system component|nr:hypothetical protein [Acidobacteriota bacterium]
MHNRDIFGNGDTDVFLHGRSGGTTILVSHKSGAAATAGNLSSGPPAISADGRYVAFGSRATDLTPGQFDSNNGTDVFLYDRVAGTADLVSHAFDTPNGTAVGRSNPPALSADGAWVAFSSNAFDVVQARDLNQTDDVFLYSRATTNNTLVSRIDPSLPSLSAAGGSAFPDISADGRWVAFLSGALNLSPNEAHEPSQGTALFLADTLTGALTLVSHNAAFAQVTSNDLATFPAISRDGGHVFYVSPASDLMPGQVDTAGSPDVFLYDRAAGASVLVSHRAGAPATAGNGTSPFGVLSGDGRFVAYQSEATDLVAGQVEGSGQGDVFLYDRASGQNALVSHAAGAATTTGNAGSAVPTISADGRFVAYQSLASDLVAGASPGSGYEVYLYDRQSGTNTLVSHAAGAPATRVGGSSPIVSADGRFVLFTSSSSALVAGLSDSNSGDDAFLWDRLADSTVLVSHQAGARAATGNDRSAGVSLSADGRFVLWNSIATDLLPGQTGTAGIYGLFLSDLLTGTVTLISHADGSPAAKVGYTTARISADGAWIAFTSSAPNVVPGQDDANLRDDAFLYDRIAGTTALLSRTPASPQTTGHGSAFTLAISSDGAAIAFGSSASDLVAGDFNVQSDVFLAANPLPGRVFFTLPPCRLLDTRQAGPALASGAKTLVGVHGACGIPATAKAVAANLTVLQPTGAGHLTLYPGDVAAPLASTINFAAGQTRANNAILRLSLDGLGNLALSPVVTGAGTVKLVIDVNGYFE